MALVSSSVPTFLQMNRRRSLASPTSLHASGSSRSAVKEVDEEISPTITKNEQDDKVYVALAKEFKTGQENLIWVLRNTPRTKKIIILHVHVSSPIIPIMGAWFPANQLKPEEVKAYRQKEQDSMEKAVNAYLDGCLSVKEVQADKLVIEADDIGQGLLQLISKYRITNLVMGAAADKFYTKKMNEPKSRKALMLQQHADSSCKIWFVCNGNLICTREAGPYGSRTLEAPKYTPPRESEKNLKFSPQMHGQYFNFHSETCEESFKCRSLSVTSDSHEEAMLPGLVQDNPGYTSVPESKEGIVIDLWNRLSKSSRSSERSMRSVHDEVLSNKSSLRILKDEEMEGRSFILPLVRESKFKEDAGLNDELYKDLKHAVIEANNLSGEAYEQSQRRHKAERDLHEAATEAKPTEDLFFETKQRKEIEARVSQQNREIEKLRQQRDEMFEDLQKEHEKRVTVELQLADSKHTTKGGENKLSDAYYLLNSLKHENEELRRELDEAVQEAKQLRRKIEEKAATASTHGTEHFSEFSYSELEQATNKFDSALKIGEGGYGSVYKGVLHQKTVAIKMLNSQGIQGEKEFHKEVKVLSRLRHPNLVHLVGVCPQAWALVYDYLPNGSLEDRLTCKDDTPPLPWQVRVRIATEICSALRFLHSNQHFTVVHGDLKPANILLDANFASKLGDFGISRLVQSSNNSTALYRCTHAMGTFVYMDPEFLASGDLTPCSDVYSLGIIILRLLTGRSPFGINRAVQDAVARGCLKEMVDASAGDWPYAQAEQLAQLGLKCCEITRKSRPNAREALRVLETLTKAVSKGLPPLPSK
ncbi:U-box domain-containing protein 33-like isoform X1 [Canna indica]|uniref:RING-type E3 ubiquitin transferase n=1 Tax=Canna indica TaxID=4628 RepID=A0AAQ3KZ99_9LILI|nr:U-box domain-containing protein 33-like isoform X1 [Canna indica]